MCKGLLYNNTEKPSILKYWGETLLFYGTKPPIFLGVCLQSVRSLICLGICVKDVKLGTGLGCDHSDLL